MDRTWDAALCGNENIPPDSLGLLLISSDICWWDWEVVVFVSLALWLREGCGGRLLFWYGGRFNSIKGRA